MDQKKKKKEKATLINEEMSNGKIRQKADNTRETKFYF